MFVDAERELWAHPLILLAVVGLLGAEWFLRKRLDWFEVFGRRKSGRFIYDTIDAVATLLFCLLSPIFT